MPNASPERPYAVLVHDEDGDRVLCNVCAGQYVGDGDTEALSQDVIGDEMICAGCGANLANPKEVGHDGE